MFVRKRDPRYKAHIGRPAQIPTPAPPATAAGTSTPKRTAPTSTFVVQDWQKVAEPSDAAADLEWARAEGTDDEEWECIVCNKTFRSEAAWVSHERSKKHIRTVEQLKREMQDEELELELGQADGASAHANADEADGQVTAGATGDDKASPDRVIPATAPNIEEATTEAKHFLGSRRRPTQNKSHTPPPKPSPAPSVPEASQIGASSARQRLTESDPELLKEFRETLSLDETPQHDEDAERDEVGPANSTKVEMSKREKRRAREAVKKAREGESKNICAVSFPHTKFYFNSIRPLHVLGEFAASASPALIHYSFGRVLFFFFFDVAPLVTRQLTILGTVQCLWGEIR